MKKITLLSVLISSVILFTSCDDNTPPSPPAGVNVFNGDSRVDISWNRNRESDVAGYNVYWNYIYEGKYTLLGSTSDTYFIDNEAVNANKYYYAVAAYDYDGNESELSYDEVYAAPRPEDFNQVIYDAQQFPNNSGFTFIDFTVVPFDNDLTDFYFDIFEGVPYLNVWRVPSPTLIQDMGNTTDIYDISYAPNTGWTDAEYLRAYVGHTYVIWTYDNYFGKIRIKSIASDRVIFDWAFQEIKGERLLKPVKREGERNPDRLKLAR